LNKKCTPFPNPHENDMTGLQACRRYLLGKASGIADRAASKEIRNPKLTNPRCLRRNIAKRRINLKSFLYGIDLNIWPIIAQPKMNLP